MGKRGLKKSGSIFPIFEALVWAIGHTPSPSRILKLISNAGGEVEPRKGATRRPARKLNLQLRAAVDSDMDSEPCMHQEILVLFDEFSNERTRQL